MSRLLLLAACSDLTDTNKVDAVTCTVRGILIALLMLGLLGITVAAIRTIRRIVRKLRRTRLPNRSSPMSRLLFVVLLAACSVTPVPNPTPTPTPVGPPDVFDDAVVDCTGWANAGPVDAVNKCLLLTDVGPCLVDLTDTNKVDAVACTVRGISMRLHVAEARGEATAEQLAQITRADAWMQEKKLGFRR
jgi:hypothetical protein